MRAKYRVALAAAISLTVLPATVVLAQEPEQCFEPGDGSVIGKPIPCPPEEPGEVPPTEEPGEVPPTEEPGEVPPTEEPGEVPPTEVEHEAPEQAAGDEAELADTGANTGLLAVAGVGALGLGAAAVVASRRRQDG